MKKIVFYIEPTWAFGIIHYELCKYLWGYGFDCQLLPWNQSYTLEEMQELIDTTDLFVTTPHGWRLLGYSYKIVDPKQCVVIGHSKLDIEELIRMHGLGDFDKFHKYGAVSEWLSNMSLELGVTRSATVTPLGINTNSFYSKPNDSLRTVGCMNLGQVGVHQHIKRPWLLEIATQRSGLALKAAASYHHSFITMPGFYKAVDAVLIASTEEGAGLPLLEAGAAGKLVISTPVGHYSRVGEKGADFVPIQEDEFIEKTTELFSYYKSNPEQYRQRCLEIQYHAQSYDWKYVIDKWIEILS
jgi:glycosyltransferase involved in cell wall biosynthesis